MEPIRRTPNVHTFKNVAGLFIGLVLVLNGCSSASSHRRSARDAEGDALTLGKVQREIRVGMTSAQVVEILGSPNVVTTDEQRREVWVYDKISTDTAYSTNDGYGNLLIIGASGTTGATSTSQKTLTVIIKFDENGKVRDFAYHTSRF